MDGGMRPARIQPANAAAGTPGTVMAMSEVGLRVNEACKPGLADIKPDLGRFGRLHVRHGKGARGSGPRERMVPLINNAEATLRTCGARSMSEMGWDRSCQCGRAAGHPGRHRCIDPSLARLELQDFDYAGRGYHLECPMTHQDPGP